MDKVIALLLSEGWEEDGHTDKELVLVSTARSPMYGRHSGGELVTLGGRKRFKKGKLRITVGKKICCVYELNAGKPCKLRSETNTYQFDKVKDALFYAEKSIRERAENEATGSV